MTPALLPVALVRPTLDSMERRDYDPFVPIELAQWRRESGFKFNQDLAAANLQLLCVAAEALPGV